MKILTGYLAPDAGTATVAGHDVTADPLPALRRIGYLPAGNPQYGDLRVVEALRFAAELNGLWGAARDKAVDRSIAAVGLEDRRLQTTGTLSTGYRQRVGLARALLHEPDVLIMDEPTSGLDPNQQQEMRTLIRGLGRERTVILSTHILPEVEAVCDRAIIIHRGRIVADGGVREIQASRHRAVTATLRATPDRAVSALSSLEGVESVETFAVESSSDHVRVRVVGPTDAAACERIAARAVASGMGVTSLAPESTSLEQIFAELTRAEEVVHA
jgi:ABC-2 type transport system ATP-binding protein